MVKHAATPPESRFEAAGYPPIKDYALIGDCGSAALVSREGSVDWLCWPRFDSPSVFARILDLQRGGHFRISPRQEARITRHYVEGTNVLCTTFSTPEGVLRITDLMVVAEDDTYNEELWPDHELLRRVECLEGEVEVDVELLPRPDYGRRSARIARRGAMGFVFGRGASVSVIRSEMPLQADEAGAGLYASCVLAEGDSRMVSMTYDHGEPAVFQPLGDEALQRIDRSIRYWKQWSDRCEYEGPFRDAVVRSALTLKMMTYSRSGAVVAAPTTSLPEHIGGIRNWDYRYCWLRDASLTVRALFGLGYRQEGTAFFSWLLYTAGQRGPGLNVLYDVYGGIRGDEVELDHLEGYRRSSPVRIGNKAGGQLQLDIFGEVVAAAFRYWHREGELDRWQLRLLVRIGLKVCEMWREPDEGIWEIRSARRHHTYSKALCWVALDRLVKMHEEGGVDMPVERFRREMKAIRSTIEERGYSERLRSYVAVLDTDEVDASLLLLPIYGYTPADHPRMAATFERIQEDLAIDGLMYRYPHEGQDGLPPGEGAFGLCSFWDEEMLARAGKVDEAKEHFRRMLDYANDVGLYAEEIDARTGEALGNFPQAFTHIGLINAAITIARCERPQQDGDDAAPASTPTT